MIDGSCLVGALGFILALGWEGNLLIPSHLCLPSQSHKWLPMASASPSRLSR